MSRLSSILKRRERKNRWNVREYAILAMMEKYDGRATFNILKKHIVSGELQSNIKKAVIRSKRRVLRPGFKRIKFSEPTLSKILDKLEAEGVISSGWNLEKVPPRKIYKTSRSYRGHVLNDDGSKSPMYSFLLWNMVVESDPID